MANPGRIILSNPQSRVKDVYAPAPKIDLTLRCNGEEQVMVMDSLGNFIQAGFDAPKVVATVTTLGSGAGFTASMYWAYQYVYVAKNAYPLVENAVTGGGSPAPRSNPSPSVSADSVTNTHDKQIDIPTSNRSDISHIWLYRTTYLTSAAEATDFAAAGNLFWIGELTNNPNVPTVSFTDANTVEGLEQIENDNFSAPQFDKVVYADPYFWGFGNSTLDVAVTVTTTGLATIANPTVDKWFSGRNSEVITFDGITSGGYDNHGSFYFKYLTASTAQIYTDIALTFTGSLTVNGSTTAHVKGPATILFRSKIRNPFAWGETDLVGDTQVPNLYAFSVGGGSGTAIAIVPNLNLLKLDTEGPNRTYTLNLKNAGTPNFETSLRIVSDTYCVSNYHSQFSATLDQGQNVLWGVDSKTFAIVQCDGSTQEPISSKVYKTLRQLSLNADDRLYFHGCYCPRLELNCIFIRARSTDIADLTRLIYLHAPTGYWGQMETYDVVCSSQIFDRFSGQMKMLVGTNSGFLGEMFSENKFQQWVEQGGGYTSSGQVTTAPGYGTFKSITFFNNCTVTDSEAGFTNDFAGTLPRTGILKNWITVLYRINSTSTFTRYVGKIESISNGGRTIHINPVFDVQQTSYNGTFMNQFSIGTDPTVQCYYYIGLIEMEIGRSFNAQIPFDYKKLEEVWSYWKGLVDSVPTIEFRNNFTNDTIASQSQEYPLTLANSNLSSTSLSSPAPDGPYMIRTNLPVDFAKVFGVILRDRGAYQSQLMNYELRIDADGNNS